MNLMKGFGLPFREAFSSCSNLEPVSFKWTTGEADIHIYADVGILQGLATPRHDLKFGWLCESRDILGHALSTSPAARGLLSAVGLTFNGIDPYETIRANLPRFKNSFAAVFTCDEALIASDPFFVYAPAGSNLPWVKAKDMQVYPKTRLCSMICSDKDRTTGQHRRLEVAGKLKDKLHLFGGAHGSPRAGEEFYPGSRNKLPALKDFMFSVAFENAAYDKYYTEKVTDCFATGTIPVYWGSSKIVEDFNPDGVIFFEDLSQFEQLTPELYRSKIDAVNDNLERVKVLKSSDDIIFQLIRDRMPSRNWARRAEW